MLAIVELKKSTQVSLSIHPAYDSEKDARLSTLENNIKIDGKTPSYLAINIVLA